MTDLPVRVMVHDVWDEIAFTVPSTTRLAELKRQALASAKVRHAADQYVLKFRGAELADESQSLTDAGIVPNGTIIVLSRHRRPLR